MSQDSSNNVYQRVIPIVTKDVLRQAQLGDVSAQTLLMEGLYTPVYHFLLKRTGDTNTAHDLIQTTFLKCYRELDTYNESYGSVKTWVFQIARNTLFDYFRKPRSEPRDDLHESVLAEDRTSDTTRAATERLDSRYIAQLLTHLTDEEADVVTLRALKEMSYFDIAHIIGKTEDAARKTYSRSIQKLRTLVEKKP